MNILTLLPCHACVSGLYMRRTFSGAPVPSPGIHLFAAFNFVLFIVLLALSARIFDQNVQGVKGYAAAPALVVYTLSVLIKNENSSPLYKS